MTDPYIYLSKVWHLFNIGSLRLADLMDQAGRIFSGESKNGTLGLQGETCLLRRFCASKQE